MELSEKEIKEFISKCEPFDCEFSFQFELAWWLREKADKILFENKKCYDDAIGTKVENRKPRCDLVLCDDKGNATTLIELKYVCHGDSSTTSVGARKSFVKDFSRLRECVNKDNNLDAYCIFLTNWKTIYNQQDEDGGNVLKEFKDKFTDKHEVQWVKCNWKKDCEKESKDLKFLLVDIKNEKYKNVMQYNEVIDCLNKEKKNNKENKE